MGVSKRLSGKEAGWLRSYRKVNYLFGRSYGTRKERYFWSPVPPRSIAHDEGRRPIQELPRDCRRTQTNLKPQRGSAVVHPCYHSKSLKSCDTFARRGVLS